MTDDIYHEIEEDIRQQKLRAFWQENRNWIAASVIGAIVMTGGLVLWRQHRLERNMQATAAIITAMDAKDAEKLAAYAAETQPDHGLLSLFAAAELRLRRGEKDEAAAIYGAGADMSALPVIGADAAWRDLARLYHVVQRLDDGDPATLHKELKNLKDSVWRWSALEMQALLYARENKTEEAAETLARIVADSAAPADLRARAFTLREVYLGAAKNADGNNG